MKRARVSECTCELSVLLYNKYCVLDICLASIIKRKEGYKVKNGKIKASTKQKREVWLSGRQEWSINKLLQNNNNNKQRNGETIQKIQAYKKFRVQRKEATAINNSCWCRRRWGKCWHDWRVLINNLGVGTIAVRHSHLGFVNFNCYNIVYDSPRDKAWFDLQLTFEMREWVCTTNNKDRLFRKTIQNKKVKFIYKSVSSSKDLILEVCSELRIIGIIYRCLGVTFCTVPGTLWSELNSKLFMLKNIGSKILYIRLRSSTHLYTIDLASNVCIDFYI